MKLIRGTMLAALAGLMCGCATPTLYRASGDGSEEIVYISPYLALTKYHQPNAKILNGPEWMYTLVSSRWLNEPESAALTGDTRDRILVNSLYLVGESRHRGLLFGSGHEPDDNGRLWPDTARFFVLAFDGIDFFKTEKDMRQYLADGFNLKAVHMDPASEFFQNKKSDSRQRGPSYSLPVRTQDGKR